MALDKHRGVELNVELSGEVGNAFRLMLPSTIREQDERYSIGLEELERFRGTGNSVLTTDEDAVDAKTESVYGTVPVPTARAHSKAKAKSGTWAGLLLEKRELRAVDDRGGWHRSGAQQRLRPAFRTSL